MEVHCIDEIKRLLESQELVLGKNSREVANNLRRLADAHLQNNEPVEAERCLLRALNIKIDIYGVAHLEVLAILQSLLDLYHTLQRDADIQRMEEWETLVRQKLGMPTGKDAAKTEAELETTGMNFAIVEAPTLRSQTRTINKTTTATIQTPRPASTGAAQSHHVQRPLSPSQFREISCAIIENSGERIILRNATTWIGRDRMNDISVMDDDSVERSHALVMFEDEEYWIINRASAGATTVNGKQIMMKTKLNSGDVVKVGNTTIQFA
jgi:hypothetical protein